MRDIIFRAWDLYNKKMYIGFDYLLHFTGNLISSKKFYFDYISKPILMEWTGVKDRNSKYVFEGDIIEHNDRSEILKIEYDDEHCCFVGVNDNCKSFIHKNDGVRLEVIGNIYENPELINKKYDLWKNVRKEI